MSGEPRDRLSSTSEKLRMEKAVAAAAAGPRRGRFFSEKTAMSGAKEKVEQFVENEESFLTKHERPRTFKQPSNNHQAISYL
ncbi:hypothetical protein PoB_007554700 [Plakobranchus ocellatus]|uniref:Uncharacterized protein n=1 Tax=Plakobranchus ocellatus TaxID=259542 RepID=A0AAV4DYD2_9GAST|nr:hypothetical protein PoB_007554700 [Plakobranchus ocellatus]